jgi:hypothetical protein
MQLAVDRSKVAKKTKVITRSKKSIVDRVIISPLGNTLRSNDKKHDLVIRDNKGRYLYYEEKLIQKKAKISISFSNIHTQDHWKSFQLKNNLW